MTEKPSGIVYTFKHECNYQGQPKTESFFRLEGVSSINEIVNGFRDFLLSTGHAPETINQALGVEQ